MSNFKHLNFEEQIALLESRNMVFDDKEKAQNTLAVIPYYKIKEFAHPFRRNISNDSIDYQGVNFQRILSRYYQDKNLRNHLFHILEDIEVALKTQLSYILGKDYGAYGYLTFKNWCDTNEYCKHYLRIKEEEFEKKLKKAIKKSSSFEIKEKLEMDNVDLPPVWLAVDLLTFGQVINMINMMSNRNISYIANCYNCTNEELKSWLKCLNFIRNVCAHNTNFIDTKLITQPLIADSWKSTLYKNNNSSYTNRIALPLMIILHMQKCVNKKYKFEQMNESIRNLVKDDEETAKYFGFRDLKSVNYLFPTKNNGRKSGVKKGKNSKKSRKKR